MTIAVFGTGMVGRSISGRLDELGYHVIIGTRDVARTSRKTERDRTGTSFSEWYADKSNRIKLASYADAASASEIIFNCTSGSGSIEAIRLAGESTTGKILIDVANPLDTSHGLPAILNPGNTDSLGELLQRTFPQTKVVKTLNTMNCYLMVHPALLPGDHNVFVSGNDMNAKAKTISILNAFGWKESNIIDLGDISTARGTEQLLPIWLRLWGKLQTPMFNFHIVLAPSQKD